LHIYVTIERFNWNYIYIVNRKALALNPQNCSCVVLYLIHLINSIKP